MLRLSPVPIEGRRLVVTHPCRGRTILAFASVLLLLALPVEAQDNLQKRVLVLYGTMPGAPAIASMVTAYQRILGDALGSRARHPQRVHRLRALQRSRLPIHARRLSPLQVHETPPRSRHSDQRPGPSVCRTISRGAVSRDSDCLCRQNDSVPAWSGDDRRRALPSICHGRSTWR